MRNLEPRLILARKYTDTRGESSKTSLHLHALFLRIADKVDVLAAKEKAFFASCKRLKASERNDEYEKVNRDMSTSV